MKSSRIGIVFFALTLHFPTSAIAGIYADELGKCLVESTSQRDRLDLVQWLFSAASLHPAVEPITSVSEEQLDASNKTIAELVTELLTDSCRSETEKALQYEGMSTLETAFTVLGQVATKSHSNLELILRPRAAEGYATPNA